MAKIDFDKIIKELEKENLDSRVVIFHKIKDYMTAKLIEAAQNHEDAQNKYLSIKDTISK